MYAGYCGCASCCNNYKVLLMKITDLELEIPSLFPLERYQPLRLGDLVVNTKELNYNIDDFTLLWGKLSDQTTVKPDVYVYSPERI